MFLGVAIAHGFFLHIWFFPSSYDAFAYAQAAREIIADGLFAKVAYSDLRTYGYPLILGVVYRLSDFVHLPFQLVLFELQLLLFVGSVFWVRGAIAVRHPLAAAIGVCGSSATTTSLSTFPIA